jgi:hypothetical protein
LEQHQDGMSKKGGLPSGRVNSPERKLIGAFKGGP